MENDGRRELEIQVSSAREQLDSAVRARLISMGVGSLAVLATGYFAIKAINYALGMGSGTNLGEDALDTIVFNCSLLGVGGVVASLTYLFTDEIPARKEYLEADEKLKVYCFNQAGGIRTKPL